MAQICEKCGIELEIGDWPYCPHGHSGFAAFHDEIPGGVMCENYGPHPIRFDSHSERKRYMTAHGLEERERFAPMPGTNKDPAGIPDPRGFVDPQTLANGAALILRQQQSTEPEFDAVRNGVIRDQFVLVGTERDAKAVASGDVGRMSRLGRRIKDAKIVDARRPGWI